MNKLEELIKELNLQDCRFILINDGSGTTINKGAASYCIIYDCKTKVLEDLYASISKGTNNIAELMGFVQALWYIDRPQPDKPFTVGLISDSEHVVKCGSGTYERHCKQGMWAVIDYFENKGWKFHWRWLPRCSNIWLKTADEQAGLCRKNLEKFMNRVDKAQL